MHFMLSLIEYLNKKLFHFLIFKSSLMMYFQSAVILNNALHKFAPNALACDRPLQQSRPYGIASRLAIDVVIGSTIIIS
jgi:hypothetical protein